MDKDLTPEEKTFVQIVQDAVNEYRASQVNQPQAVIEVIELMMHCTIAIIENQITTPLTFVIAARLAADQFENMCHAASKDVIEKAHGKR